MGGAPREPDDAECAEPEQQAARLLGDDEADEERRGGHGRGGAGAGRRRLPAVLLGSVLAASAAATLSMQARSRRQRAAADALRALQVKAVADFPSLCGKMEEDVEYVVEDDTAWGTHFDHIHTAEMCCAMCQGEPKCESFTWVADAGLDGCPSQCWLKGAIGAGTPKPGLVSGVPPRRLALPDVPSGLGAKSDGTSLYCVALMVPGSYEEGMVLWQHKNKVSLFACNAGEIFSNESVELAPGLKTSKINSDLKCEYGGDSGTALNAWIFIEFWRKVLENKVYSEHDWTVKVDVDAVFFPDRLLTVLKDNSGAAWISNCKYGLHGPIEVVSSGALDKLAEDYEASFDGKAPKNCVEKQDFGLWGEDMFLGQCLDKVLEVGDSPVDPRVLCEDHCDCPAWYWCQNGTDRVSFHPFKTVGAYKNCMANAMGGEPLPEGASALDDDDEEFAAHSPSTQAEAPESEDDGEPADADAGEEAEVVTSGGGGESLGADTGEESTAHTAPHPTESQADFYADEDGGGAGGGGRAGGGAGSCADYGCTEAFNSDFNCQCNKGCKAHNSCCPDFEDECGGSAASGAAGGKSASGDSCQSDCDVKFDPRRTCQCNALCESHGNCCDDYLESCAGGRA